MRFHWLFTNDGQLSDTARPSPDTFQVGRLPKTDDVIRAIKRVHTTQETEKSDGAACII